METEAIDGWPQGYPSRGVEFVPPFPASRSFVQREVRTIVKPGILTMPGHDDAAKREPGRAYHDQQEVMVELLDVLRAEVVGLGDCPSDVCTWGDVLEILNHFRTMLVLIRKIQGYRTNGNGD